MFPIIKQQQKERIKARLPDYLQTHHNRIISPSGSLRCIHPENHKNGDKHPSMHYNPQNHTIHCFACGCAYDLISLIAEDNHFDPVKDFPKVIKIAFSLYPDATADAPAETQQASPASPEPAPPARPADMQAYFNQCQISLANSQEAMQYLYGRGFNDSIIRHMQLGYDPSWRHPKVTNPYVKPTRRIILPTSANSYLARDIDHDHGNYVKMKVGKQHIFNSNAIRPNSVVYITEGEFDTIAIEMLGFPSTAIGSVTLWQQLVLYLEANRARAENASLLLALDNDKAGIQTANSLQEELQKSGFTAVRCNFIAEPYKDPAEKLQHDPDNLESILKSLTRDFS